MYSYEDDRSICTSNRDCNDNNVCTLEKCQNFRCVVSPNLSSQVADCCRTADDCPEQECKIAYCSLESFRCTYSDFKAACVVHNGLSSLYDDSSDHGDDGEHDDSSHHEDDHDEEEEEEHHETGIGDYFGAAVGFLILGIITTSILLALAVIIVQKIKMSIRG